MASSISSQPLHHLSVPPTSSTYGTTTISGNANGVISDSVTYPPKQMPSEPNDKPKNKVMLKIRLKHRPIPPVVVETEPSTSKESCRSFHLNDQTKPTDQPYDDDNDEKYIIVLPPKPKNAAKKKEKKRGFLVPLSREEIERDIAAIEALAGLKRLRRPKKRDQSSSVDRRQLDRLFPGLGYRNLS